ncbi:uncharacterized protein LY89DRAFT_695738 [Mollisia scopiformis]|uniref:Uncharacterized protein n=1 Tax=Mollisia scopiformis TaxID=149040 RepID=A0A194XGY9_MOLSC|nr:uncharacterized protein LY89DRAFT_695738 [Mollisia scopiformis]KUJ19037.1 hypothetical protein LY89DRAFT_695738 [Mollisia scopiformis]
MERKAKTIFQLDTPFTAVEWPKISDKDQKVLFDLLCRILSPIGQYRNDHVMPSKGKRSQKRKRQEAKEKAVSNSCTEAVEPLDVPPPPEIQKHLVVGLNSILRHLQSLSRASRPEQADSRLDANTEEEETLIPDDSIPLQHFSVIFALQPAPTTPTLLTTHLPTLIYTSSLAHPSLPPTRLIPLSNPQTTQLKTLLSLARTSHIGILSSAPGAEALIAVVRETVPEIKIPWLDEVKRGEYLGVKINAIDTFVGVSKKESREKEAKDHT